MKNFILGTAALGHKYSLNDDYVTPPFDRAVEIIEKARAMGFGGIDTAPAYGDAEEVVGATDVGAMLITTKVSDTNIVNSFNKSEQKLGRIPDTLLLHRERDWSNFYVQHQLSQLKYVHDIDIGVSLYEEAVAYKIADMGGYDVVQIPYNCLNMMFLKSGAMEKLFVAGIKIVVRNVFARGLLLTGNDERAERFKSICRSHKMSYYEGALSFVRHQRYVDEIVIGIEKIEELDALGQYVDKLSDPQYFKATRDLAKEIENEYYSTNKANSLRW